MKSEILIGIFLLVGGVLFLWWAQNTIPADIKRFHVKDCNETCHLFGANNSFYYDSICRCSDEGETDLELKLIKDGVYFYIPKKVNEK